MAVDKNSFKEIAGGVCASSGFKVACAAAGIRKADRDDVMLLVSDVSANCAGVLTTNQVRAWCVQHNSVRLESGKADAIICSAGNANACNGEAGKNADRVLAQQLKETLSKSGRKISEVLTASTGVIGRELKVEKLLVKLPELVASLGTDAAAAANAIMTTDLVPKSYALEIEVNGNKFHIGGIAKGSGMIAPNMATMFGFITTDLEVPAEVLKKELKEVVDRTFNCITVDGDTSTNDMVLMLANGVSGLKWESVKAEFSRALRQVCEELAKMIARDGEGATKLVHVKVSGAGSEVDCRKVAKTIAESPLVKTACFGNDPNWGRILAAAGRSGVSFKPEDVAVSLAGVEIFRAGEPTAYNPDDVSAKMKAKDLDIEVKFLDSGSAQATVWTCDFSYDYVKINADYGT